MLKHYDIISKMTDSQKIRLLTSVGDLSSKDFKILGIPKIKIANVKDYGRELYPHANAFAHSWNEELWESVAREKAAQMIDDGVDVAIVPGAKIKLSPYRREISEDPCLSEKMSLAFMRGVKGGGMNPLASGYYLTGADTEWLDKSPSERAINELVVNPYLRVSGQSGGCGVITDNRNLDKSYADVCRYIQNKIVGKTEHLICKRATDENTVALISKGIVCFEASANALETALTRYRKLTQIIENNSGEAEEELNQEIADGIAISTDAIDRALDTALDFIFNYAKVQKNAERIPAANEDTAFYSTLESAVLLKNQSGILPLPKRYKYAVIGDFHSGDRSVTERLADNLASRGYKCVGTARGYDREDFENSDLRGEAISLCNTADCVILFLGFGYAVEKQIPKTEKLTLPANQLLLANELAKSGKKIIAVISSGHAPDVEFTRDFSAVLLAPLEVKHSADATTRILCGEYNPSGKLAYTLYAGSERAFQKRKVYRNTYGVKSGPFVGYRYYDTADMLVGYPFGHGLSYSDFTYSAIRFDLQEKKVHFVLENVSDRAGAEVAQVYIGINSSSVIRPKKELCGFAKVFLNPGESRSVSVDVELPEVYQNGENLIEGGNYTLYVGSSVSDIRLKHSFKVDGGKLEDDGERLSDYLQTESNILSDNFTLEAKYGLMKKSIKNILFGIGALALAIAVAVFNSMAEESAIFLSVVSAVLAVSAVAFFIIESVERNKRYKAERQKIDESNKEYFEDAEQVGVFSTEKMFIDEFDSTDSGEAETVAAEMDGKDNQSEFIDSSFTFSVAVEELSGFFAERGFKLDRGVAESILASMATSKLLFVNGMDAESFNSFMVILSEYFETEAYVDDEAQRGTNLFFSYDDHGELIKSNVLVAMENSKEAPEKVYFAALNNAGVEGISEYVSPFARYLQSQKPINDVSVSGEIGYSISANVWLVVNLKSSALAENIPVHILKLSSVVNIAHTKCQKSEFLTTTHGFSRYQIEYMLEKCGANAEIPEEIYKKVDRLEKYAAEHSPYVIGNKLFLFFERYVGLLLSCETDASSAADSAVASRILPSVLSAVSGALTNEDKTVSEMVEFIFGEEHISFSKAFLDAVTASRIESDKSSKASVKSEDVKENAAEQNFVGSADNSNNENKSE